MSLNPSVSSNSCNYRKKSKGAAGAMASCSMLPNAITSDTADVLGQIP